MCRYCNKKECKCNCDIKDSFMTVNDKVWYCRECYHKVNKNKIVIDEIHKIENIYHPKIPHEDYIDLRFDDRNEDHVIRIGEQWYYIQISEWGFLAKISEEEAKKCMTKGLKEEL